jgi:hypothetical protein
MGVTATSLTALIEGEISVLKDPRVINHIRGLLIAPQPQMRPWDYGTPGEAYECWLVLADASSNAGIAYCESGFGPATPWGLVSVQGQYMSMGMDSGWFKYFLDANQRRQQICQSGAYSKAASLVLQSRMKIHGTRPGPL